MNRDTRKHASRARGKSRSDDRASGSPLVRTVRGALIGVLLASLLALLLLLLLARVAMTQPDPDALVLPVSLSVLLVTSLLCGMVAQRASGEAVLPVGATAGGIWLLVGFLFSLLVGGGKGALPSVYAMALRIPQLLLVILGAYVTKRRPRKISSRRRR